MLKRRNKAENLAIGVVILFALLGWGIAALNRDLGTATLLTICIAGVFLVVWYKYAKRKARIEYLSGKYGDARIVDLIMRHCYWQGQTAEQLTDSRGNPEAKDDKLLKTKKREVWKYNRAGVNRYALRITLDDGIVTGWDQKQ
jgi:hypothetical protein